MLWRALKNPGIRKTVLTSLLDCVLECVGVSELKEVLVVVRERIGELGEVEPKISFIFLRILNTLLKRISKTTAFQVRGELHLTITRIITFCHESGFEYHRDPVPVVADKPQVEDAFLDNFSEANINM
jgi:hypothetical protein